MNRVCCRCFISKPLDEFVSRKDRPFGKDYRCKECDKKRAKKRWIELKKDDKKLNKHQTMKRRDYAKNPEKFNKRSREYYQNNKESILAQEKDKYMSNPKKKKKSSNDYRKRKMAENPNWKKLREMAYKTRKSFNEVETWFNNQWMKQQAQCDICGKVFCDDDCIDHDHTTNELRGLLCSGCNLGIGHLKDSADLCQKAANYLTKCLN